MLCYRDRTYCNFISCKKFDTCSTAATAQVRADALKVGLPICYYADKPECYEVDK